MHNTMFALFFFLLAGCYIPPPQYTEQQKREFRRGLGASADSIFWEVRTLTDKMTGEIKKRAVSPPFSAEEGQTGMSFMCVVCNKSEDDIDTGCLVGLLFFLQNEVNWEMGRPIDLRVRFGVHLDSGETTSITFLPLLSGGGLLAVHPKDSYYFAKQIMKSRYMKLELRWATNQGTRTKYYYYSLMGAWKTIKQLHPDMSLDMFKEELYPSPEVIIENQGQYM